MAKIMLTNRDAEILEYMARLRFLTMKQMATLFYTKHKSSFLEMEKAISSMRVRVSQLISANYVESAYLGSPSLKFTKGYFLGPNGIEYINDLREKESYHAPRWLKRRHSLILTQGPHHVITNNFLINLLMLSRFRDDFTVVDWRGDRDITVYLNVNGRKHILDPDLYVCVKAGDSENIPVLMEIDRDTHTVPVIRRKIYRFFEFYDSGADNWFKVLGERCFPRIAIVAPDDKRVNTIVRAIGDSKSNYRGRNKRIIEALDFWLASFSQVDVFSIEDSYISDKPLEPVWVTDRGKRVLSPFLH